MRVEMLIKIGGFRDGAEWPDVGGTIEVPDHEAGDLLGNGYAKEATDEDATTTADPAPIDEGEARAEDGDAGAAPEPVKPARKPRTRRA